MEELRDIPLELVFGNPNQPRKTFDLAELEDLAASIREGGLHQPIRVTPRDGRFMIVMGERRFRAHELNGAPTIRCIVAEAQGDLKTLVQAIVENRVRVDVHPMEEARAFQDALDLGLTPQQLATQIGLQQAWRVTERTDLLNMREEYQRLFRSGQLGSSQATELSKLSHAGQDALFRAIRRGECKTYDMLRSTALVLRDSEAQRTFLDDDGPTPNERALARGLERRFSQVIAALQASTVENEVVAVKKVDPGRAGTLADMCVQMRAELVRIEAALRAHAQAELAA